MAQEFKEKSWQKIDQKKLDEGLARVYGPKDSVWCDQCEKRKSWCECPCVRCNGAGHNFDDEEDFSCWVCNGTGKRYQARPTDT